MNGRSRNIFAGLCALALSSLCMQPASAQNPEVKEKAPMYSYIANWQIPRAHWGDMAKTEEANKAILDKALGDGTIVGYGSDENVIHEPDGYTHDEWWSSKSMAGLLKVLDQFASAGQMNTPGIDVSTRHADHIQVSRFYNYHPGTYKNAFVQVAFYKLKADAPDDAVETLSKLLIVPLLEKVLADGTIVEYEIDTQAVHSDAPGSFAIVWVSANADAVDKVNAALREAMKAQPLGGPAFGAMVDFSAHRDELWRGTGIFK